MKKFKKSIKSPIKIKKSVTKCIANLSIGASLFTDSASSFKKKKKKNHSIKHLMKSKGYIPLKRFAVTSQGSVWQTSTKKCNKSNKKYVIKVTKRGLHNKSICYYNGHKIDVKEDIIKETQILRYLTANKPPSALTKFIDFFSDQHHYALVMEDGGEDFFQFVQKCHVYISNGKLAITEWHRFCKIAMRQIVFLLDWMHNKMNCCHLDIALENFVIDNIIIMVEGTTSKIKFSDNFQIKLVDFGLAEVFTAENEDGEIEFSCQKYVGRIPYRAPKVYQNRPFDARSADCWSLGVVLFVMIIGSIPFQEPSMNNPCFQYIINGQVIDLIDGWSRFDYVNNEILDLLNGLFKPEKYRLSISDIKNHSWLL